MPYISGNITIARLVSTSKQDVVCRDQAFVFTQASLRSHIYCSSHNCNMWGVQKRCDKDLAAGVIIWVYMRVMMSWVEDGLK